MIRTLTRHLIISGMVAVLCFNGAQAQAQAQCADKPLPSVVVHMSSDRVKTDYSKSRNQLSTFSIDTVSPYDTSAHAKVGGLMSGEIAVNTSVNFGYQQDRRSGQSCHWYEDVEIKIHIDPTIFIASEYPPGTCMHTSIMDHEMKHIQIDQLVVKKYANLIESDVKQAVRRVGTVGPVSGNALHATRDKMMQVIQKVIGNRTERMYAERRKRQQDVDNLSEYESVVKRCH